MVDLCVLSKKKKKKGRQNQILNPDPGTGGIETVLAQRCWQRLKDDKIKDPLSQIL